MDGGVKALSKYRFERAVEDAIFHCMRAVNTLDAFDSSKHSSIIAYFNQYHVKTGDFAKETSKIIRNASEMREHADYEDFFIASSQDAEEQVQQADLFLGCVKDYLKKLDIV